jgi:ABC-type lipoprotein export system ATPase subunit
MSISLKRKGTLFVLVAPSGGGKSTVLKALLKQMDSLSIPYPSPAVLPLERGEWTRLSFRLTRCVSENDRA